MHKRTRQHAGFTLVELMVAVSILGLMLFLINELFNSTSQAVTTSVQTSKAIATTRVLGEQIGDDTTAMVGPGQIGGFGYIVIIQHRMKDVAMLDPDNLAEVTVPQMRSDQIVFIRNAGGLRSMTPENGRGYGSNLVGQSSDVAKVWYGHVQRAQPDGQRAGTNGNFQLGGATAGFDRIGSDFILGRQALLFNPLDPDPRRNATIANNRGLYTHAEHAYFDSRVGNIGNYGGPPRTYMGLTDVTAQPYQGTATNALLTQLTDPSLTVAEQNDLYLRTAFPNPKFKLHVNTSPTQTDYESWAIAQGHPILAPNCSEVIIQFAADLNGNGRIDTAYGGGRGNDQAGSIFWYDALSPNQYNAPFTWAKRTVDTSVNPPVTQPNPYININGDTRAFVFRVDDDQLHSQVGRPRLNSSWPYLIRIRYRLHDTRGRMRGNNPAALRDGIDNDGDGQADANDPENNEDQIAGRWFEHIIRVPRP